VRAAVGCLVALVGGIVGSVVGVAVTYAILAGQGVDALVWAVTFVLFALIGLALGAGAAFGLLSYVRSRKANPS
jgi:hypothetical protein